MEDEIATARRYLKALDLEPGATWEEVRQDTGLSTPDYERYPPW